MTGELFPDDNRITSEDENNFLFWNRALVRAQRFVNLVEDSVNTMSPNLAKLNVSIEVNTDMLNDAIDSGDSPDTFTVQVIITHPESFGGQKRKKIFDLLDYASQISDRERHYLDDVSRDHKNQLVKLTFCTQFSKRELSGGEDYNWLQKQIKGIVKSFN